MLRDMEVAVKMYLVAGGEVGGGTRWKRMMWSSGNPGPRDVEEAGGAEIVVRDKGCIWRALWTHPCGQLCSFGAQLLPAFSSFTRVLGHWPSVFSNEGTDRVIPALRSMVDREWGRLSHSQSLSKRCRNHILGR